MDQIARRAGTLCAVAILAVSTACTHLLSLPLASAAFTHATSNAASAVTSAASWPPFRASGLSITNKAGGSAGVAEAGDVVTFTYNRPILSTSILSSWDGSTVGVVIRITSAGGPSDSLQVLDALETTALPIGTVDLGGNYISGSGTTSFAASQMTRTASTTVTIVLGTPSGATRRTEASSTVPTWSPSAAVADGTGNPCTLTTYSPSAAVRF